MFVASRLNLKNSKVALMTLKSQIDLFLIKKKTTITSIYVFTSLQYAFLPLDATKYLLIFSSIMEMLITFCPDHHKMYSK